MTSRCSHEFWTILVKNTSLIFNVISAAPQEIVQSAWKIVPPDRIFGTRFPVHEATGEVN